MTEASSEYLRKQKQVVPGESVTHAHWSSLAGEPRL